VATRSQAVGVHRRRICGGLCGRLLSGFLLGQYIGAGAVGFGKLSGLVRLDIDERPLGQDGVRRWPGIAFAATAVVAAGSGLAASKSPAFTPLREGPALGPGAGQSTSARSSSAKRKAAAISETAGQHAVEEGDATPRVGSASDPFEGTDRPGVDHLSVKRRLAPISFARRRGNIKAAVGSAGRKDGSGALTALSSGFYAKTSEGPRRAVLSAVKRILAAAGFACLPLTAESLKALAAALKEAGYRSAKT
jgi:hypothetical protein